MNYNCITLHNEDLNNIIDASIPNKSQNQAVKVQINRACDQLMNRIAEGWLEEKNPEASKEMNEILVKRMVDRFLGWTLPENFNPDGGVSFKRIMPYPMPTGTNVLDANQAEEMIRYLLAE